ncbi:unnamed protein product [Rhizoctonia solani]|uniref:Transmembrane protein n=1 Tax=Rhizoctonia solani TaxID=456999 RepID=A0A8H3EBQ6_9AGAM|nr:unnamed protein product [Rhizoctonia solani]CAE7233954.1 unnamed protein product [Rhizoctonia solani]
MVGLQIRDGTLSPVPQNMEGSSQPTPLWIPIVICAILVAIPISVYLAYLFYTRRPRRVEDKEATPVPPSPDIKWTDPFDTRRPSANKWTLSVPKWTTPGGARRGSDGGFPPGTRHIAFPDPTIGASVESLDNKIRYPTPPPAVHVAARSSERSYARAT